jgi:hypothetical protein
VTNLTGTASININGTVGATTASTGAFTTLTTSSTVTLNGGTANGVAYLNGSKVLTTGSALTFSQSGGFFSTTFNINSLLGSPNYKGGIVVTEDEAAFTLYGGSNYKILETDGYSTPSNIKFYANNAEQMRLTSTGLGIGTSSPGFKLDVAGTVNVVNGSNGRINIGATNNYLYGDSSGNFIVGTSGSDKLQLTSSGNLGLGVTPSAWNSAIRAVAVGRAGTNIYGFTGSNISGFTANAIFDASDWKYVTTDFATRYQTNGGGHFWFTAPSGTAGNAISFTQAMTLDASGYLLVGATSSAGVGVSRLQVGSTGAATSQILVQSTTTHLGVYASSAAEMYMAYATGSALIFGNGPADGSTFTERARIDSSGTFFVAKTSTASDVTTAGGFIAATGKAVFTTTDDTQPLVLARNNTTGALIEFFYGGSIRGSVSTNGTSTAYNTSSDYRLKNTIAPMTGALAKVALLKPCTYKWNADGSDGEGFIAHELAEVVPQCVTGEKDAVDAEGKPQYQGIDTSFLVATLTAAIQEQQAIINSLKARLDAANL